MEQFNQYDAENYKAAAERVKKIKGFYVHLIVYLFVNFGILVAHYVGARSFAVFLNFGTFSTAFFWGIGLVAHGASVFVPNIIFGSKWEERKIKEYMDREKKNGMHQG